MPVYRLTPLKSAARNPLWRCSTMQPHCLWVRARDEFDARRLVALATTVEKKAAEDAPWKNAALVACEYDDSRDLAAGIIYVRRLAYTADQGLDLQYPSSGMISRRSPSVAAAAPGLRTTSASACTSTDSIEESCVRNGSAHTSPSTAVRRARK